MKRRARVVLSLTFSLVLLNGCQKAEDTNRAAAPCPTPETVDTAAIESELLRIENDLPRVIKEKDVEAVRRVEADDAVLVYPDGTVGNKNTDLQDVERGALSADSWEILDLKVNVLNKDAAVVTGRSIITNGRYKTPDGKSIDISGHLRFIDTFARRNGQWQLVAGAATPIRVPPAASPSPSPKASPAVAASPAAAASPATTASPTRRVPPVRVATPRATVSPAVDPTP